tara:strand:- start:479 stop:1261 length:783 start_codon:yes stop_codon:yes gene_type:complete
MASELKISMIQSEIVWENPMQNRVQFELQIAAIPPDVVLIVLPEMFTTGFTMNAASVAEKMDGPSVAWMQEMAANKKAAIVGSLVISERGQFYNRLLFVHPSGKIDFYDKRHSFTLAKENEVYTAGTQKRIVTYKGWKICPLICYDLRFPVWSRNTENYDLLLYVANWPTPRIHAWNALLQARAIENMSYTIGVNRVGQDANGHDYAGMSAGYDGLGNRLTNFKKNEVEVATLTLYKLQQDTMRRKLSFLNDQDLFEITT